MIYILFEFYIQNMKVKLQVKKYKEPECKTISAKATEY